MPPRPPRHGHGPHRHRHVVSALEEVTDGARFEEALALVVPDPRDRAFVARCILEEGPAHHRAASWALIVLAADLAKRAGATPRATAEDDDVQVQLRLPPHLAHEEDTAFPLRMPAAPLRSLARDERAVEALTDALVDGPPHHALANAALVALFERLADALAARRDAP